VKMRAGLIACAVVAAVTPTPPAFVERWYSGSVYPVLQRALTTTSNAVTLALLDGLVVVVLAVAALGLIRGISRRRSQRGKWRILVATLNLGALVAALYLTFLATWGLNYRRVPLIAKLDFNPARVSADRARDLASESAARLNALHAPAHASPAPPAYSTDAALADAFNNTAPELGIARVLVLPRPKRSMLDGYFRRAGVAGMTDPFFLEALISSDLLPFERPFVVAHEWSHAAGIADEGDANFAGWLTCLGGTPAHQYSAWLFAYTELAGSLEESDRRRLAAQLDPGPQRDLRAIRDRLQAHVSPRVSAAGWRVYDQYLKANRIPAGTASYSQVVRLMLGVQVRTSRPTARLPRWDLHPGSQRLTRRLEPAPQR
jgi:hypothetical protein